MLEAGKIYPGSRLLDVGCGDGTTVESLLKLEYDATGIDVEIAEDVHGNLPVKPGSAYAIPCEDSELDGILCECVFSLLDHPGVALAEFKRVLRPRGALMLSDLYSRAYGGSGSGMLKNIYTRKEIYRIFREGGFSIEYFEDHSEALKDMFAQLIFDMGGKTFLEDINMDFEYLKKLKCGYFLLAARPE
jgi:ubiquinone/menaquinone biosynthesis C-methylase UbiE